MEPTGAPAAGQAGTEPRTASAAGMGRRCVGFVLDVCVAQSLVVGALLLGSELATGGSPAYWRHYALISFFAFCGYRAIASWRSGTTAGKTLLGMSVVTADGNSRPGLAALLLREFVGYPVSSIFWGVGYWGEARRGRAWSDRMAGTSVVRDRVVPQHSWVLGGGLIATAALLFFGRVAQLRAAREGAIQAIATESKQIRATVTKIRALRAEEPDSLGGVRIEAQQQRSLAEKWDTELVGALSALHRAEALGVYPKDKARAIESALALRRDSASALKDEAAIVLAYDPERQTPAALQRKVGMIESNIRSFAARADALIKKAGSRSTGAQARHAKSRPKPPANMPRNSVLMENQGERRWVAPGSVKQNEANGARVVH